MKEVSHFRNCWAYYGNVLTDICFGKVVWHATAPTHRATCNVQEEVSGSNDGTRHSSMNVGFNVSYFVQS